MINVKLKESNPNPKDLSANIKSPIVIDVQLDTSLDSGTINYLATELDGKGLNEALASYSVNGDNASFDFVGMDSRAFVKRVLVNKTVTQEATITNLPIVGKPPTRWKHSARGEINVPDREVTILRVSESISNTIPTVKYNDGVIVWEVSWTDLKHYSDPYTVTIEYECLSSNSAIYSHQVSLTEPSKLLQGVMIDGFGVSQPEDYEQRQTLEAVVNRLLAVTPFDDAQNETPTFTLTNDETVLSALQSVKSPQFKWNTQTSLWECLVQVGAVIDAMPMLVADSNGNYTVVTFEFVNVINKVINEKVDEAIDDGATNAVGENVDERLYNSALSSIVENLREED